MNSTRRFTLLFGPIIIVGLLYRLTMYEAGDGLSASEALPSATAAQALLAVSQAQLERACQQTAEELAPLLDSRCEVLVRAPYVLAGDLTADQLEQIYRNTIRPTASALSTCYFDTPPTEPITILLFSGERKYSQYAKQFDGREWANYHGYYQRTDRRIVLNYSTGNGTLAHELTHALAHVDFPAMPEWFDEGLASLHEQSRFSEDGLRLEGTSNWRLNFLLPAIHADRLPTLEQLMSTRSVRSDREAILYAQARYFCLYLQSRRLLGPYYRKFRHSAERDPTGIETLKELLNVESLDEVDADFREWLIRQELPGM